MPSEDAKLIARTMRNIAYAESIRNQPPTALNSYNRLAATTDRPISAGIGMMIGLGIRALIIGIWNFFKALTIRT